MNITLVDKEIKKMIKGYFPSATYFSMVITDNQEKIVNFQTEDRKVWIFKDAVFITQTKYCGIYIQREIGKDKGYFLVSDNGIKMYTRSFPSIENIEYFKYAIQGVK